MPNGKDIRQCIPKAVLFSGGRTSGLMLKKLLDSECLTFPDWIVVFCNTGKERNETLDFVHEVEIQWNVPIIWLEYHRVLASTIEPGIFPTPKRNLNLKKASDNGETTHWFKQVNYETASRNGEPFDELLNWMSVLPNVVSRGCSMQLKIRTAMRYLFSLGVKQYSPIIGIRKDEEHRATQILSNCDNFESPQFPLIKLGITKEDVMRFWGQSPFDLKLKDYEGNCDLCFLKAKWKRILLIQENPKMAKWWKGWEQKKNVSKQCGDGKYFRLGEPYADLEKIAKDQKRQDEFCFVSGTDSDIPCSCAEKGFGSSDEE
jgi:3'-phosphoadenosine 5'-phosphosulfate sulfotransferase (PAPS reductase)/FAD synthetase